MREKKSVFIQKIHNYSKSTHQMMSDLMTTNEMFYKIREIVLKSETEAEAVEKLKALQK